MLVRDDDIPEYVADGVCDLGIVEKMSSENDETKAQSIETVLKLDLEPADYPLRFLLRKTIRAQANGKENASRLHIPIELKQYLDQYQAVKAQIVELSGSVEIAPSLQIADGVCDLF